MKNFVMASVAAAALAVPHGVSAQELIVGIFGGSFADNSKLCHVEPFEKATGARVRHVLGSSVDNVAKMRATKGSPDLDIA